MSNAHSFNVRLNRFSHWLLHSNELQTAPKEKTTKLRIHQLKNIIVTKIILQANFWKDKNYHKYETKLRKWEAYYSICRKMMPDFCRTIFENPFGFNATLSSVLYTKTHNLEIQHNWKLLKDVYDSLRKKNWQSIHHTF